MVWNYKFDSLVVDTGKLSDLTVTDAEKELNDKSAKGWELLSAMPVQNPQSGSPQEVKLLLLYRMPLP